MVRVLAWAACCLFALVALSGPVAAAAASAVRGGGLDLIVWTGPRWWIAAATSAVVLALVGTLGRPSVRRLLLGSVAAFVAYVVVGSALSASGATVYDPAVPGSGWVAAATWIALASVFWWGNAWAALLVPIVIAALPPFRAALVGSPVVWAHHRFGPADDDAAAEDFGIF